MNKLKLITVLYQCTKTEGFGPNWGQQERHIHILTHATKYRLALQVKTYIGLQIFVGSHLWMHWCLMIIFEFNFILCLFSPNVIFKLHTSTDCGALVTGPSLSL